MSASKANLDLRSQVGQLLIMGFDGVEWSAKLQSTLASLQPGGVILFARNITSAAQTYALLRQCGRAVMQPPFLCVDLEGGTVDRLRDVIAPAPSLAGIFATGGRRLWRQHGRVLGQEARALGFNTDFAPVLDLAFAPSRNVLASRTASADPKKTASYAREFLKGLKDSGVLGCGKHFPGLGEADLDTHKELPSIRKPWKRLWEEDVAPYRMLRREMAFVMVAHACYPEVTPAGQPASLSRKWLTEVLREKIGYRGLIVSDDLEMGGVLAAASIEDAALGTIEAGADVYLVCHDEEKVWRAYEAVLNRAERDHKFAALVADRARRILGFKRRTPALRRRTSPPTQKTIDGLRRKLWTLAEEVRLAKAAEL